MKEKTKLEVVVFEWGLGIEFREKIILGLKRVSIAILILLIHLSKEFLYIMTTKTLVLKLAKGRVSWYSGSVNKAEQFSKILFEGSFRDNATSTQSSLSKNGDSDIHRSETEVKHSPKLATSPRDLASTFCVLASPWLSLPRPVYLV